MKSKESVMRYRSQIISAVIGALLSGVISLSVGLYSLSTSFHLAQTKERRAVLRNEQTILKKVERELDHNLDLLLNENLQPSVDFKKVEVQLGKNIKNPDIQAMVYEVVRHMTQGQFSVTKAYIPQNTLLVTAWPFGMVATEINFDLCEDIHELYLLLDKIDHAIYTVDHTLRSSSFYQGSEVQRIKESCEIAAKNIQKVQRKKIIDLKNRVAVEGQRIAAELKALSD